jgi:chorismate mutase/prephenate dehydratase
MFRMANRDDLQQKLEALRLKIDQIDRRIVEALNERAESVVEIGRIKQVDEAPIYAPDREKRVLEQIRGFNRGPMPDAALGAVWREIMSASFSLERRLSVAILGPAGSFSHLTARRKFGASTDYLPLPSIAAVFNDVAGGRADMGLVPIENSIEGGINETRDSFLDTRVRICAEVQINIHHNLLSNSAVKDVRRIYSKANGFNQCRAWLGAHMHEIEQMPVASTSRAAEMAAAEPGTAAIGSSLAAELYELQTLHENIEDDANNTTRFLVIARESPPPAGDDKTAVMFTTAHKTGALASVLDVFRDHKLNLTHIDTRPSRRENWQYYFFVDLLGHEQDETVRRALEEAQGHCLHLTVLGSFPRAGEVL